MSSPTFQMPSWRRLHGCQMLHAGYCLLLLGHPHRGGRHALPDYSGSASVTLYATRSHPGQLASPRWLVVRPFAKISLGWYSPRVRRWWPWAKSRRRTSLPSLCGAVVQSVWGIRAPRVHCPSSYHRVKRCPIDLPCIQIRECPKQIGPRRCFATPITHNAWIC